MKKLFILLLCGILPQLTRGQFEYFNNYFYPPDWENGNGVYNTNLLVRGDSLVAFGNLIDNGTYAHQFLKINPDGDMISETLNLFDKGVDGYIEYEESMTPCADGSTIWAASVDYPDFLSGVGTCVKFNADFSRQWTRELVWTSSDTSISSFYCAQEIAGGSFIAAGFLEVASDLTWDDRWDRLLIAKYSASGDSVWEKTIPLYEAGLTGNKRYIRINHIFEQPNGDLLLTGALLFDWDQCFIRLTSEGEFISIFTMGGPLNEWLPWCADRSDGKILFGYNYCTEYFSGNYWLPVWNLRTGLFDPEIMDTVWTQSFNHTSPLLYIMDFELTSDNGGIMLVDMGAQANLPEQGIVGSGAYLLKLDSIGNEEWFKKVPPPIELQEGSNEMTRSYGIEILPDGGIAGVGNLNPEGADYGDYITWLWRVDCMGNLELPPISFTPGIQQMNDSTFYLTLAGENLYDFQWDLGNGDVEELDTLTYIFDEPGEYTITASGRYCALTLDSTFTVIVPDCMGNPETPNLSINSTFEEVNDSTFLFFSTPENLENITWYFGDDTQANGIEIEHSYLSSGEFEVVVCGEYCDSLFCESFEVTATVGVNEFEISELHVFPNPFDEIISIYSSQSIEMVLIRNTLGEIVLSKKWNGNQVELEMNTLARGIYHLEAVQRDGSKQSKVLIKD